MGIKVRFDGLDVMAMVSHLNHVALGRRVINIYEGDSNDAFLFKFDHSGHDSAGDKEKEKLMLYMESGIRFHTTNMTTAGGGAAQNKNAPLAPFVFQLRKQLRGLRLEQVTQLGKGDRVVHFVFGMGEQRRCLLLELYAKGNIVLTDANYQILALLRSHHYAGDTVQVKVGHVYPVTYAARNVALESSSGETKEEKQEEVDPDTKTTAQEWATWAQTELQKTKEQAAAKEAALEEVNTNTNNNTNRKGKGGGNKKQSKKDKQAGLVTLKTLLLKPSSGISHYGPNFLEHCILVAGMTPNNPLQLGDDHNNNNNLPSPSEWEGFLKTLQEESAKLNDDPKATTATPPKGYILYSMKDKSKTDENQENGDSNNLTKDTFVDKVLEEFQPYLLLKQHEGRHVMEFDTFNHAVDTFFGHLEAQKRLMKAEAAEQAAKDKLEKVRRDQKARIEALEREVLVVQEQAQVVELNAVNVDKALVVVNSALDSGMDWEQLEQLVQVEQEENRNPIALLIHELDLENDVMILELPNAAATGLEEEEEGDEDDNGAEQNQEVLRDGREKKKKNGQDQPKPASKRKAKRNHIVVPVSLKETAHANASALFAKYRSMKEKTQRTIEASTKALKAAEETAQRQLADAQQRTQAATHTAVAQVKPPWFTKFHWFITSDNYLVLGGRDAHQNEVLVKKYLRTGDAYLHADVHGAASCILRAKRIRIQNSKGKKKGTTTTKTLPLSEQALREAGNFTICRSSAWASKMVTSAWWVESHQVSKTAPTGEYLKVGAFMIRGKKNFLPPSQLELGLGVIFRLAAPDGTLDPATAARHKNERRDFALMELLQRQEDMEDESESDDDEPANLVEAEKESKSEKISDAQENHVAEPSEMRVPAEGTVQTEEVRNDKAKGGENDSEASEENTKNTPPTTTNDTGAESKEKSSSVAEEASSSKSDNNKKNKKGLSVKERKLIKKYGSLEEAERVLAAREREEQEKKRQQELLAQADEEEEEDEEDVFDATSNTGSLKRGKRGKKKKLQKKYADQDEEDRELAMLALQGGEKIKKKDSKDKRKLGPTTEEQKQAAAETAALMLKDAEEFAKKLPEDIQEVLAQCVTVKNKGDNNDAVRWDKFDADVLEQLLEFDGPHEAKLAAAKRLLFLKSTTRVDNFSASLAGILRTIKKYGHENLETEAKASEGAKRKTKEEKKAEDSEWKQTLAEEGVLGESGEGDDDDADVDDTAELNKLTGKPYPEDTLLYALPVCAPYSTLSQYTYRVKLTPGNIKRGKAAKQCVEMFLRGDAGAIANKASTGNDATKDLIKKVIDNDWGQVMCSDVKIAAAGASKVIKKQKANNKAKAKKKK